MDAGAEGQMLARPRPVDDEALGLVDRPPRRGCPRRTTSRPCRPARMRWPPSSVSRVAVRRMWMTGVCQRMVSGTRLASSAGSARSLAPLARDVAQRQQPAASSSCASCRCRRRSAGRELPMNSRIGMSRVASPCAIIEMQVELAAAALARSFHSAAHVLGHVLSARRSARPRCAPARPRLRRWRWRRRTTR